MEWTDDDSEDKIASCLDIFIVHQIQQHMEGTRLKTGFVRGAKPIDVIMDCYAVEATLLRCQYV